MKLTPIILSISIVFVLAGSTATILASNIENKREEFIEQAKVQETIINAVNENVEIDVSIEQDVNTSTESLEIKQSIDRLNEKSARFQRDQEEIIDRIGRLKIK